MINSYNNKMMLSKLQRLANRCLDVIDLVKAAEPSRLQPLDLSALAHLAYAAQVNDVLALSTALNTIAEEFQSNLYTQYCQPSIKGFVDQVQQLNLLSEPKLTSLKHGGSMFSSAPIDQLDQHFSKRAKHAVAANAA